MCFIDFDATDIILSQIKSVKQQEEKKMMMMMKKLMEKNKALINIDKTARCIQTDMHTQSSYESI